MFLQIYRNLKTMDKSSLQYKVLTGKLLEPVSYPKLLILRYVDLCNNVYDKIKMTFKNG